jgi:putative ABC transport system substrate-binding protein
MSRLAISRSATNPLPGVFDSMREAAERRGIAVQSIVVQKVPDDIPAAIDAAAADHADAILQVPDATFDTASSRRIAELARASHLPYFASGRGAVVDGGLMTTTTATNQPLRLAVQLAARVLHGERPGDIPVAQPEVTQLIINLKTAQALGLTVPDSVRAKATELLQ